MIYFLSLCIAFDDKNADYNGKSKKKMLIKNVFLIYFILVIPFEKRKSDWNKLFRVVFSPCWVYDCISIDKFLGLPQVYISLYRRWFLLEIFLKGVIDSFKMCEDIKFIEEKYFS